MSHLIQNFKQEVCDFFYLYIAQLFYFYLYQVF